MTDLKHHRPEERKSHFRNVASVAMKDGVVAENEKTMLQFVADKWGLTPADVDEILADPNAVAFKLPQDKNARFHQLYDLTEMMIIDGKVSASEKELCLAVASKLGYGPDAIAQVIKGILDGNRAGDSEESIQRRLEYTIR